MIDALRPHWKLLLVGTVVAAVGIQLFEPDYNKLQTAHDAAGFIAVLESPGRAIGAACCDILFAVGYGLLGLIGLRAVGAKGRAAQVGAVLIAGSALCDILENLFVIRNAAAHETLTDAWIVAMRVPGTLKWMGSPVLFVVLVLLARQAITRRRTPSPSGS